MSINSAAAERVVLITGASSGIGKACAVALLQRGFAVYGAARRLERLQELQSLGLRPIRLDVTDSASCRECIERIASESGRLDILINAAGYGAYGAFEEVGDEEAKRQFEVNVFGLANITRLALPLMRRQQDGRIVNLSSMAGKIYTPMGAWYYASKHAVEALSDSLRCEVRDFGIKVIIIEPGMILTEWSDIAVKSMQEASAAGPYAHLAQRMQKVMDFGYRPGIAGKPEDIAKLVIKALSDPNPRQRYAGPWDARLLIFMRKYLPDCLFDLAVRLFCCPGRK
ncbi:SDR family NAD(P)-dependent oxidoreductase [bacterium]|nr:SDR family NAD(P)-dependent oxidoreductase [bacterium]